MAKTKTLKAQVTVSIPRAGEFNLTIPVDGMAFEGLSPARVKELIQMYCTNEVTGRLKVKVVNVADLAKKFTKR